jgi:hypothetical protein
VFELPYFRRKARIAKYGMKISDFLLWFLEAAGWRTVDYLWHLLGCLALWVGLCLLPPVNRVSAFVFAFSAWFLLLWAVDLASVALRMPYFVNPMSVVLAAPIGLFGYCAVSSLLALRAQRDVESDAARFIRWRWSLLLAHLIHVNYLSLAQDERAVPY